MFAFSTLSLIQSRRIYL